VNGVRRRAEGRAVTDPTAGQAGRALEALGVADRLRSQGAVFPDSVSSIGHARAHVVRSTPAAAGA
jgi:hypothetical protein